MFEKLMTKVQMTGRSSAYRYDLMSTASRVGVGDELLRHKFIQTLLPEITPVIAAVKNAPPPTGTGHIGR